MKCKEGVTLDGLRAEILAALIQVERVHKELTRGRELVVTSTTEGKHSVERSAHYRGDAADVRIWYVRSPEVFRDRISETLGPHFVVLLEYRKNENGERVPSHIHIHWSPIHEADENSQHA